MGYFDTVKTDWKANIYNPKGRFIMLLFRTAQKANSSRLTKIIFSPYLIFYIVLVEWIFGIELSYKAVVGKGLMLWHGQALVVNPNVVIGEFCSLRHSTTIGNKGIREIGPDSPVIGNYVDIGSNVCIIGHIHIGDFSSIGAGSVVVKDVPIRGVAVGNPAKTIRIKEN